MNYSKDVLLSLAKESHYLTGPLEKALRLLSVLDRVFGERTLGPKLVLKGGTAINLVYAESKRLSVDIDLDYVGSLEKETTQKDRAEILSFIEKTLIQEGYVCSPLTRDVYALSSRIFYYQNAFGNKDALKIEINYLDRLHVLPTRFLTFSAWGGTHQVSVLAKEEVYGSKIAALLNRAKVRDLYDILGLARSGFNPNDPYFHLAFLCYLALDEMSSSSLRPPYLLDRLTYQDVRQELKPVLSTSDPFALEEGKSVVSAFLSSIVLTENEKAFLDLAQKKQYDFSLISSDGAFIEKMEHHPLVLWYQSHK